MTQFDFTRGATQRGDWDECDAIAANEQSEPDPKRQCMEHAWTTHDLLLDPYPSFSSLVPVTHAQDAEVSIGSQDIWASFEDEVPASNFDLMRFFNVENEHSSDLAQQSSGFRLQPPEASDAAQSLPTPNSDRNYPDVQPKITTTSGTLLEDTLSTPQIFVSRSYDTCFGMVSGKFTFILTAHLTSLDHHKRILP